MRSRQFSVAFSCILILAGVAANAKDTPAKLQSKKPLPTLAPPTAEWPVFPTPESATKPSQEQPTTVTPPEPTAETPAKDASVEPVAPLAPLSPAALTPAQMEPHKRPVPDGYAAAAELFKQKKFPQAQKAFENIIKSGVADINTHLCLAHCLLQEKLYSKAIKEFDWLSEHANNSVSLKNTCGATARTLRYYMSGVCPSPCIKVNDSRWHVINGKRWITIRYSSKVGMNFSEYHIGEIIANENGVPVSKGQCPTCGGTGQIAKLKDGDPMPRL